MLFDFPINLVQLFYRPFLNNIIIYFAYECILDSYVLCKHLMCLVKYNSSLKNWIMGVT